VPAVTDPRKSGLALASAESVSTTDPSDLISSTVKALCREEIPDNPVAVFCVLATGMPTSSTFVTRVSADNVIVAVGFVSMRSLSVIANEND
jgi:hypothetical protein